MISFVFRGVVYEGERREEIYNMGNHTPILILTVLSKYKERQLNKIS